MGGQSGSNQEDQDDPVGWEDSQKPLPNKVLEYFRVTLLRGVYGCNNESAKNKKEIYTAISSPKNIVNRRHAETMIYGSRGVEQHNQARRKATRHFNRIQSPAH